MRSMYVMPQPPQLVHRPTLWQGSVCHRCPKNVARCWLTSPDSIDAATSHRRKISVILSLLPRWRHVCPSGPPLVESFSSRARSAREAWVRPRSQALARQRSRAWVRPRSQALVRQRSLTARAALERREFMAESRQRPLAASVGAPTVASVGAPTVASVGAPTVTSVGAPTVAPRSLSQNSNAGPTPANARGFGQAVCHAIPRPLT